VPSWKRPVLKIDLYQNLFQVSGREDNGVFTHLQALKLLWSTTNCFFKLLRVHQGHPMAVLKLASGGSATPADHSAGYITFITIYELIPFFLVSKLR